ncbi:hypothetical protein Scep_014312 [Stephania cephalantha]|uniref:Uncharacterized protein n=1 Tax=Stephania cephalantha TaxID=152367 RepID=A0AAP0J0Z2_9MAGN
MNSSSSLSVDSVSSTLLGASSSLGRSASSEREPFDSSPLLFFEDSIVSSEKPFKIILFSLSNFSVLSRSRHLGPRETVIALRDFEEGYNSEAPRLVEIGLLGGFGPCFFPLLCGVLSSTTFVELAGLL